MTWSTVAASAANVALIVAAVGCIVFVAAYQRLADWRSSELGRNVMAFMTIVGVLLSLGVVRALVSPPDRVLEVIRLVGYLLVAAVVWHRVLLLFRYQRRRKRAQETRDRSDDDEHTPERGIPAL